MRVLLATDAWLPQVNGVVRTWQQVIGELEAAGDEVEVVHPGLGRTIAAPRYPEIRLALRPGRLVDAAFERFRPEAIHIATEGPIGMAAARSCRRRGYPFTTSYHTQFPHYLKHYFRLPMGVTYAFVRRFHGRAAATLVPTEGVAAELRGRGLERVVTWCRGVDVERFRPEPREPYAGLPKPICLYAGRVAVEKNIEAFLGADLPGSKVVVGDGPTRAALASRYPKVHWAGYRFGEDLAKHYAGADVFVFPSRTDTFGIVMLEANACGLPIAAYPVTGPKDVVRQGLTGWLDEDLGVAVRRALELDRDACVAHARTQSWGRCAERLRATLARIGADPR